MMTRMDSFQASLDILGEGESSNVCISCQSKHWALGTMKLGGVNICLLPHMFSQSGENYFLKALFSLCHSFSCSKVYNASCCSVKPTRSCCPFPIKLLILVVHT